MKTTIHNTMNTIQWTISQNNENNIQIIGSTIWFAIEQWETITNNKENNINNIVWSKTILDNILTILFTMKTINRAAAENRAAAAAAAARCFGLLFWLYFCLQTSVFICPAGRSLRSARARVGPRTAPGRRRPPPCQAARKGDGGGSWWRECLKHVGTFSTLSWSAAKCTV